MHQVFIHIQRLMHAHVPRQITTTGTTSTEVEIGFVCGRNNKRSEHKTIRHAAVHSVCLPVCPFVRISVCMFVRLLFSLSVCLLVSLWIRRAFIFNHVFNAVRSADWTWLQIRIRIRVRIGERVLAKCA